MPDVVDKASQRYGWLAVLQQVGRNKRGHALWECVCLCGGVTVVYGDRLRGGRTRSCGCLQRESRAAGPANSFRHGMAKTPEYKAWNSAVQRTCNPRSQGYKDYGARDIGMAPEWRGPGGFEKFYEHIGPRPEGLTLDRIDNDRGYEPGNVRWAGWSTQRQNRRPQRGRSPNG